MESSRPKNAFWREVVIAQQYPGLRLKRKAVHQVIHVLDAQLRLVAADANPSSSSTKLSRGSSKIPKRRTPAELPSVSPVPAGELSLVFLTDQALADLHEDFLDDPSVTDVITFEGDALAGTAGEICVSVDTAARYAEAHARSFAEELTLYLVHGWLHLAGYDDLRPVKKRRMRAAEKRAMSLLQSAGAIPEFQIGR